MTHLVICKALVELTTSDCRNRFLLETLIVALLLEKFSRSLLTLK